MVRRRIHRGFSLVEVIVASMILSGGVVAICSVSTRSFLGVKLNRDYEHAWDLLDRQLTMIDYMGVDEFLESGETSGICEGDNPDAVHYWQAAVIEDEIPGLYTVDIVVSWQDGPRLRQVTARTMLTGAPPIEEEPAEGEQPPAQGQAGNRGQGGGGGQGTSTSQGGGQGTSSTQGGGGGTRGGGGGGGGNTRGGGGGGGTRGGGGGGSGGRR